jgi:hypothetical protein
MKKGIYFYRVNNTVIYNQHPTRTALLPIGG